jgi:hypothetical protein
LFRAVTAEGFAAPEFFDSPMHRIDCRAGERFRNIANAAANDPCGFVGFAFRILANPTSDFGEKVTSF